MCDLWSFQPLQGWQLVYVCPRDRAALHASATIAGNDVAMEGPSASIFSTTWVQMHTEPTLWMFGGVTDCPGTPVTTAPRTLNFSASTAQRANKYEHLRTVCDSEWMLADPNAAAISGCSSDLWRFTTHSRSWNRVEPTVNGETGGALPNGRCGAFYVDTSLRHTDGSRDDVDGTLIGGGWSGAANGQCATASFLPPWFQILHSRGLSIINSPTDQPASVPWAAHGMSTCVDAANTWQMELQRDS